MKEIDRSSFINSLVRYNKTIKGKLNHSQIDVFEKLPRKMMLNLLTSNLESIQKELDRFIKLPKEVRKLYYTY